MAFTVQSISAAAVTFPSPYSVIDNRTAMTFIHDEGKLYAKSRLCSVETILLTCENPTYTFNNTGLLDLCLGLICPTIQDATNASTPGDLILPYTDTPSDAAQLIDQFKLHEGYPCTYLFIERTVLGGSSEVKLQSMASTFNYIKMSRHTSGIQFPDAADVDLWESTDNAFTGFFIIIQAIDFTPGSEKVRLIASQQGPVLQSVTCCRYSDIQTLDLPKFIQTVNPDRNLDSWSYFGTLTGTSGRTYAFIFLIQKSFPIQVPFFHHKLDFAMASGFNDADRGIHYTETKGLAGGFALSVCANEAGPTVELNPWSLSGLCEPQIGDLNTISVKVTSGSYGDPGATYRIEVLGLSGLFNIRIDFTDVLGIVREGFGPDSFLINWITSAQRTIIDNNFGGSAEAFLASGQDDMACQGSYYFSQPLLRVTDFMITDLVALTVDNIDLGGINNMWFDSVTQSYDAAGVELLKGASWDFFAIRFIDNPGNPTALMVTRLMTPGNGYYYMANLFQTTGPTIRWGMNDISIIGSVPWVSPKDPPGNTYNTRWDITLTGAGAVTMTLLTNWNEQEACTRSSGQEVCKYEGIATVTGTVLGVAMTGTSWIETAALPP